MTRSTPFPTDYYLPLFLLVSLLVHVLAFVVLPLGTLLQPGELAVPLEVELRPAVTPPPLPRELDSPPAPATQPERTEPARRLGLEDRVVKRETAPSGRDNFDSPGSTAPPTPQTRETARLAPPKPATAPAAKPPAATEPLRPAPDGTSPAVPSTPSLDKLTQLPQSTQERYRERTGVEEGDLQLDTRQDLLTSFFRRFRLHVLGSWNYPAISRQRLEQGACLARVTVDKQGKLLDLQLLETSGYSALDEAAMEAVRRSAPYGPLSEHYPEEKVSFTVMFVYRITGGSGQYDLHRR